MKCFENTSKMLNEVLKSVKTSLLKVKHVLKNVIFLTKSCPYLTIYSKTFTTENVLASAKYWIIKSIVINSGKSFRKFIEFTETNETYWKMF